jgi:acetolactate synthase-1/2/3 large subunit
VLTAGPGVTNGVSTLAQAHFNGSPMVVVGGRAPNGQWGKGALQEIDHVPIVAPVTKFARTLPTAGDVLDGMHEAFTAARSSHRGPAYVDIGMDEFFNSAAGAVPTLGDLRGETPDSDAIDRIAGLIAAAQRPVLILGTDVWADHAEPAALRFVEALGIPAITNGMGRGIVPGGHPLLMTKARGAALGGADLVVVVGTPLDFRLGYGVFGGKDGATPARVVHIADSPVQLSEHSDLAASVAGDLTAVFDGLQASLERGGVPDWSDWVTGLQQQVKAAQERDATLLSAEADPIHPARIYGDLVPRLAEDAVVIGDGGAAAGSTPDPTAASAPGWARPLRPGSRDPPPRWCCCSVTVLPVSR